MTDKVLKIPESINEKLMNNQQVNIDEIQFGFMSRYGTINAVV